MPAPPTYLTGAAGEYTVAAELSRRGWLATVTIKNAPGTDVLAQRLDDGRLVGIQTKTSTGNGFLLGAGSERPAKRDDSWYVLVLLPVIPARARCFVVPSDHIAAIAFASHRFWLSMTKRDGTARKDSDMRQVKATDICEYEDAWDLLDGATTDVPFLGASWLREAIKEFGLPDDHGGLEASH